MRKIYPLLYDHNILFDEEFLNNYERDLQGWGGHRKYFKDRIFETNPDIILEVGSWKGKSAVAMADICAASNYLRTRTEIVCIDTWLGATEFWTNHEDEKRYKSLGLKNGYPSVYYQFLYNVWDEGHASRITPFPQTSMNAARFLKAKGVQSSLIYLDGSHEYEDVKADLEAYWQLLEPGGTIFGDDYCEYWQGVIDAVDEFVAKDLNLEVHHERYENPNGQAPSDYWLIRKPQ
jgi:hypothetical protein